MTVQTSQTRQRLAAGVVVVLSIFAAFAERAGVLSDVRTLLMDVVSPARLAVLAITAPQAASAPRAVNGERASSEHESLIRSQQLLRQALIENARLRRDLKRTQAAAAIQERTEPAGLLARFDVIRADVLSDSGLPGALRDLMIDAGRMSGVSRSELVIDGAGLLVDAGTDRHVAEGDRVLTGTVVVGRIEKTARWVSLVQPVTAVGFKAQVTLLRSTPAGQQFGASGLLEGTGESDCRITGLAHTDVVAIGDDVISADVNGVRGPRLYFGKVVRADFLAGGQWDVRVEPAAAFAELDAVGILSMQLNQDQNQDQK